MSRDHSSWSLSQELTFSSYLITDYDQSNFSVSQCKFEDGVKSDIVTITSGASIASHSHITRAAKIGISIGSIVVFLLCVLVITCVVRKRRNSARMQDTQFNPEPTSSGQPHITSNTFSTQEIAENSLIGPQRELPDNEIAELRGMSIASQPSNQVQQRETSLHSIPELRAQCTPQSKSLVQPPNSPCRRAISVSTKMTRHSWTSIGSSAKVPCVETTICSQTIKPIDVYRSLPSTPISESLQISPIVEDFDRYIRAGKCSDVIRERSALVKSVCGSLSRVPSNGRRLNAWQRSFAHLSYTSMDIEITIPPGMSEPDIIRPLNIPNIRGKSRRNFF